MNNLTFAEAHFSAHEKRVEDALAAQRAAWPKDGLTDRDGLVMLLADVTLYALEKNMDAAELHNDAFKEVKRRKKRKSS